MTSRKTDRVYPFEVLIEPPEAGFTRRSKVMFTHLRGVDRQRIIAYYGSLTPEAMQRVDDAIRIATGLTRV